MWYVGIGIDAFLDGLLKRGKKQDSTRNYTCSGTTGSLLHSSYYNISSATCMVSLQPSPQKMIWRVLNPNGTYVKASLGKCIFFYFPCLHAFSKIFVSCFHGMLHAIVPLLSTPELRNDLHLVNPLFDQLRLNTLEFLMKARELSPSEKWMEKCKLYISHFQRKPSS